jgi:hypothetical protein
LVVRFVKIVKKRSTASRRKTVKTSSKKFVKFTTFIRTKIFKRRKKSGVTKKFSKNVTTFSVVKVIVSRKKKKKIKNLTNFSRIVNVSIVKSKISNVRWWWWFKGLRSTTIQNRCCIDYS